jgi:arsenite methyltransferase
MVSLALDSAALAASYDRVSDRQFNHGKLLIEDLRISPGSVALDVGCGTGRLGAHVADLVGSSGEVRGVDPLPLRVELANRKARPNFAATVGRAEDLGQFADQSFDVVYLNSVFHWVSEKAQALREAHRVLKPGGKIGISTAAKENPHDFEGVLLKAKSRIEGADALDAPSGAPYKVSANELRSLFVEAGFETVTSQIRTFTDHFVAPDDVFEFNLASSFGNFLAQIAEPVRDRLRAAIRAELELRRDGTGIRLQRHLIFAVGRR